MVGANAVVGGSVFVTSSVPPNSVVTFKPPELRVKTKDLAKPKDEPEESVRQEMPDYVI